MPLCVVSSVRDALSSSRRASRPVHQPLKEPRAGAILSNGSWAEDRSGICYNGRHMVNKIAKVLAAAFLCLLAVLGVILWMASKMIVVPPGL